PIFEAAESALAVWSESEALSCSATRRMAMSVSSCLHVLARRRNSGQAEPKTSGFENRSGAYFWVREHRKRRSRPFAGRPHRNSSDDAGRLQGRHQLRHVLHLDASLAAARLLGLQHLEPRLDLDPEVAGRLLV